MKKSKTDIVLIACLAISIACNIAQLVIRIAEIAR